METPEKAVLKRKRQVIATKLQLNKKYIATFKKEKMLNNSMLEQIMGEASNFGQVIKFVELLVPMTTPEIFENFCEIIEKDHIWVCEELKAELKAEKGELEIEPYIKREAGRLIEKMLANTLRLNKIEKESLMMLLAWRTQFAKEVWMNCLRQVETNLQIERAINEKRNKKVTELFNQVEVFVRVNKKRLRSKKKDEIKPLPGHVDFSNREGKLEIVLLEGQVNFMFELCNMAYRERVSLVQEKTKALKVLECDNSYSKLDSQIKNALTRAASDLMESKEKAKIKEEHANALHEEVTTLKTSADHEIQRRVKLVTSRKRNLEKCNEKIKQLQREIDELEDKVEERAEELAGYRKRAENLEKNRRLGYVKEKGEEAPDPERVKERAEKLPRPNSKKAGKGIHYHLKAKGKTQD